MKKSGEVMEKLGKMKVGKSGHPEIARLQFYKDSSEIAPWSYHVL